LLLAIPVNTNIDKHVSKTFLIVIAITLED